MRISRTEVMVNLETLNKVSEKKILSRTIKKGGKMFGPPLRYDSFVTTVLSDKKINEHIQGKG